MDKSFDFNALLKQHTKKHKRIPEQFTSVEGGIQKRLQKSLKNRKSSRLSVFDSLRNLPKCESPAPKVSNASQKLEHRKQQLEKWKLEKEQKKKEDAKNKKKPFLVGVAHGSQRYLPPPPPPTKPMPSTSGRVTRSQFSKTSKQSNNDIKNSSKLKTEPSFAPANTLFRPPQIKNLSKYPVLAPITKKNTKKYNSTISFDPVLPKKTHKVDVNKTIATMPTSVKVTKASSKKPVVAENNRVTRSRAADLKSQSEVTVQNPKVAKKIETSTSTSSLEQSSSIEKSPVLKLTPHRSSRQSINKTPRNSIPKSESSSEEKLRSPKNVLDTPMTPTQIAEESKKISPCVTLSRGKTNARIEMKKKIDEGLLDADASSESVEHFRRQLASETDRINAMCDTWDDISQKIILPDHVQEAVLSAVGQARLLVAQKFQQFAGLVARCQRADAALAALVTPADLAGFWDMLFIQVENVDMRFKKLEELRASGWQECDVIDHVQHKTATRKVNKPVATSRIRDIIAAARKAKQQQQATLALQTAENKIFEAGFFCVRSPVQSPVLTPQKQTLLKAVLSSEAKKASASKNSASLAMLRASMIGKDMENDASDQSTPTRITPVNLYATPARSILKSTNKETARKSKRKSIKVVLFDDSDNDVQDSSNNDLYQNATESKIDYKSPIKNVDLNSFMKENNDSSVKRRSKLIRQSAVDDQSPVQTRSRRKSMPNTPKVDEVTPLRSARKKVLHELQDNVLEEKSIVTPKRTSRRRKSGAAAV